MLETVIFTISTQLSTEMLDADNLAKKYYDPYHIEYNYKNTHMQPNLHSTSIDTTNIDQDSLIFYNEVETIKTLLKERINIEFSTYWSPEDIKNDNHTLFIKCDIPKELEEDYDLLWDFEVSLYTHLKDFFAQSKKIKMIALL